MTDPNPRRALVTGSTGYIGNLLVPALLDRGWRVGVLVRDRARLAGRPWAGRVDVIEGNAENAGDLAAALAGVDAAWYLLHSMDGRGDFVERDRRLATDFAAAARAAAVGRIVYLSGLHPEGKLSSHLASRVEVGDILMGSGVPTTVLQAGIVLGAGSASFDMLRHLTERLPVVVAPRWLDNRIQPIAADDVVYYLAAAGDLATTDSRTYDVGGPDVLTYGDMMRRYAQVTGLLPRLVRTVPVLTPTVASHWVGLVTPVSAGVARPLVGSLIHEAVCGEEDALRELGEPPGGRAGYDEAIRRATRGLDPKRWGRTAGAVAAATAAAALAGGLLTNPGSAWYRSLRKPVWQPPAAAFPIVWTTLYGLIAVSSTATIAEMADEGREDDAQRFSALLGTNLALNAAWSGLFFRAHTLGIATVGAGALAGTAAELARRAAPLGKGKAASLGAYAAWCAFATVLSGTVARLNRDPRTPQRPTRPVS